MATGFRAFCSLLRWLGPWTPESSSPSGVSHHDVELSEDGPSLPGRIRVFRSVRRPVRGVLFVMPGVHHEGPGDPRMMRFCSILANAGFVVGSPFIPDLVALKLTEAAVEETIRSIDCFLAQPELPPELRPGIVCISTASILGAHAVADPRLRERLGGLVLFGGFANWSRSLRFMMTGILPDGTQVVPDPLNQSVVFLNLAQWLPGAPLDISGLCAHWRRFIQATWEKPEMLKEGRYLEVARGLASSADPEWRELFEVGTTLRPRGMDLIEQALARWEGERTAWLDPGPRLREACCPIAIVHGREDRVIPWSEAAELERLVPERLHRGTWVTGFYDHTRHTGFRALWRRLPRLPLELWRSIRIIRTFVVAAGNRAPQGTRKPA